MDLETRKQYTQGEIIKNLVKGEGWLEAKRQLLELIADMNSVENIDLEKGNIALDVGARQLATKMMLGWIQEIEGQAEQHRASEQAYSKIADDEYIKHIGD